MDASCKIQGSIHVFRLVNNMCPGKWVHINMLTTTRGFLFTYSVLDCILLSVEKKIIYCNKLRITLIGILI